MHKLQDAISFEKATEILGVNRQRVWQMVESGELTAHKINSHMTLYERADVIALASQIERGTRRTHASRSSKPNLKVNGKPIRIDDGISTTMAAEIIGLSSAEYVCTLIRTNRLKAYKFPNVRGWVVSQKDAENYRDEEFHGGRPRNGSRKTL